MGKEKGEDRGIEKDRGEIDTLRKRGRRKKSLDGKREMVGIEMEERRKKVMKVSRKKRGKRDNCVVRARPRGEDRERRKGKNK